MCKIIQIQSEQVSLLIQVTAVRLRRMETKHRKGDFLLKEHDFPKKDDIWNADTKSCLVVALTGTIEKFASLLDLVAVEGKFVDGISGCEFFAEAGSATEPVTTDSVRLMTGKQRGQKEILLDRLKSDKEMRDRYRDQYLLLSSNDINTDADGIPLTKSVLQKEADLLPGEYNDLITASLKYLAMRNTGMRMDCTWKELQSSWELVDKLINNDWKGRSFLPIDYQTIDAFDLEYLSVNYQDIPRLERRGPTIAVVNRAYANLELDFRKGNELVSTIVGEYLEDNWNSLDFNPDRYPLGIRHKDLLSKFIKKGQHVLFSDHELGDSVSLKDWYELDRALVEKPLSRIEGMLNGFNSNSVKIARERYQVMKDYDYKYMFVITRKPGSRDRVQRTKLPNEEN